MAVQSKVLTRKMQRQRNADHAEVLDFFDSINDCLEDDSARYAIADLIARHREEAFEAGRNEGLSDAYGYDSECACF